VEWSRNRSIVSQAYSPLGGGHLASAKTAGPALSAIATAHNRSTAEIALRFIAQNGVAAIPKASSTAYMLENMDVYDFTLTSDEMRSLGSLASPMGSHGGVADSMSMMCVDHDTGRMARCIYLD
jgi:diketogulonate reductase-like aldo/keto reductase